MLIRHNVRTGRNQNVHFAHDTDQPDVDGCYVSGSQVKVWTSQSSPCPQCKGYGKLVPITPLPRNDYPQGSIVPDRYRVRPVHRDPATTTSVGKVNDPEPVAVVQDPPFVQSEPTTATGNGNAMAEMFEQMIQRAIQNVADKISEDAQTNLANAVEDLQSKFDETVKRLIVPTTIRIEPYDRPAFTLDGPVHAAFEECLNNLLSRKANGYPLNVFLVGPAGCGKTTLAEQLAKALGVTYRTTPQVLAPYDILGFVDGPGNYHKTPCYETHVNGGLHLGDEYDGWSPEAALAQNGILANTYATFPNSPNPVKRNMDSYWVVAGNTWGNGQDREYVGRVQLDAASVDRFVFVPMDYDRAIETAIAGEWTTWRDLVWHVRDRARELHLRIMAGTRSIEAGCAMLAQGQEFDHVAATVLRKDLDDLTWEKVSK